MKKITVILGSLISILIYSNAPCGTYSIIENSFNINGGIYVQSSPYNPEAENYYGSYNDTSSAPLNDSITHTGYWGTAYAISRASQNEVYAYIWAKADSVHASATTLLTFKPNFTGEDTIQIMGYKLWYADFPTVSIRDLDTGTLIYQNPQQSYGWSDYFTYSAWNPFHTYELDMGVHAIDYMDGDSMAEITNDITFVLEPTTILLFGFGLVALAGVGRFKM